MNLYPQPVRAQSGGGVDIFLSRDRANRPDAKPRQIRLETFRTSMRPDNAHGENPKEISMPLKEETAAGRQGGGF